MMRNEASEIKLMITESMLIILINKNDEEITTRIFLQWSLCTGYSTQARDRHCSWIFQTESIRETKGSKYIYFKSS